MPELNSQAKNYVKENTCTTTHSSSIIEAQMSILAAEPPGEAG
jgi:hypothetical protein